MNDRVQQPPSSALAHSAARQLKRAMDGQSLALTGRRLTIHDVAELPARNAVFRTPALAAGAHGAVARAMAQQSGVTLERLHHSMRSAALVAHSSTVPLSSVDSLVPHTPGSQPHPGPGNTARQQSATVTCHSGELVAMCADLNRSLPTTEPFLLDALIIKLVACCLLLHPALNPARAGDHAGAVNLAIGMRSGEQWHMPVLHNAARRGIASITQQLTALSGGAIGQALAHDSKVDAHNTFALFNFAAAGQDTQAESRSAAYGASLTMAPIPDASTAKGSHDEYAGPAGPQSVKLTVRADARLADQLGCTAFLGELSAMFAEPRRALL